MSILAVSPQLPSANPNNAGARYVHFVEQSWGTRDRVFLVPDGDSSRRAANGDLVPPHRFVGRHPRPGAVANLARRAFGVLLPVLPAPAYLRGIIADGEVRHLVRNAAVVDLQWEQVAVIVPLIRLLNPKARVVCTLHDVLSLRFDRSGASAGGRLRRIRWAWASFLARALEAGVMRHADDVVVLSEKDRALLPGGSARVHVVNPPLAPTGPLVERRPAGEVMLFVAALYRWDNSEGLSWFITECLPKIRRSVPGARLRVAGAGAGPELRALAADNGVELLEFVEDLGPVYAEASVVVIPLRHGAGTKFKVIDALAAGVPVVSTSVGAEGIGTDEQYAGVVDAPAAFAERVIDVLTDPARFELRAGTAQMWAMGKYGGDQFLESMDQVYGKGEPD